MLVCAEYLTTAQTQSREQAFTHKHRLDTFRLHFATDIVLITTQYTITNRYLLDYRETRLTLLSEIAMFRV